MGFLLKRDGDALDLDIHQENQAIEVRVIEDIEDWEESSSDESASTQNDTDVESISDIDFELENDTDVEDLEDIDFELEEVQEYMQRWFATNESHYHLQMEDNSNEQIDRLADCMWNLFFRMRTIADWWVVDQVFHHRRKALLECAVDRGDMAWEMALNLYRKEYWDKLKVLQ
jgi:hypothetical protein